MKFLEKLWKEKYYRLFVEKDKDSLWIHYQGRTWFWKNKKEKSVKAKSPQQKKELIQANLPGRIQKVFVQRSDKVKKGQNLLILSAMKIEYSFKAEGEAEVEELFCKEGQTVELDQKLIKLRYF